MELFIRPLDTQFYRSGLPFDAGQDTETGSTFPPFPRTFYGALRTRGLIASGKDISTPLQGHDWIYGSPSCFGELCIKGPFLARLDNQEGLSGLALPFPYDLVMEKESKRLVHLSPSFDKSGDAGSDLEEPCLHFLDQQGQTPAFDGRHVESLLDEYYLPLGLLSTYLVHQTTGTLDDNDLPAYSSERLVRKEVRIGIARDNTTRTARESMLYKTRHFRLMDIPDGILQEYGFWVQVKRAHNGFPGSGILKLGGESRAAFFVKLNKESLWWSEFQDQIIPKIASSGRFKAYFITPALFKEGALPDNCKISQQDKNVCLTLSLNSKEISFVLVSICTGKPLSVAGWDIHKKQPKSMRPALPAGSVYFFQAADQNWWEKLEKEKKNEVAKAIYETWNFNTWCSEEPWDGEHGPGKEGFGIPLIGGW